MEKTRSILILLWATGAPERDFLLGFARFARKHPSWSINLMRARESVSGEIMSAISAGAYDGIVTDEATLKILSSIVPTKKTALVIFGTRPKAPAYSCLRVSYIENDNAEIGRVGARHFRELGKFSSFGFVLTAVPHAWSRERARGFRDELAKGGANARIFDPTTARTGLSDWLRRLPKPTGVMVSWDNIAIEVIDAARRGKMSVPEQVGILGVDNDELLCNFSTPAISSLCPSHEENGYKAAEEMDGWLNGRYRKGNRLVVCSEVTIAERESTAPLAPAAHIILAATEFIRRNACRDISVQDVVDHLGISRRLADLRFAEFGKESIRATIERYRLEEVRRVLVSTAMPIKKVAAVCGFTNVSHLETVFRKRYGSTMLKWRHDHP